MLARHNIQSRTKTMKRYAISVLLAATAQIAPAMAHAGTPCWIERVVQTAEGVALHFTERTLIRVEVLRHQVSAANEAFVVQNGVPLLLAPSGAKETEIVLSPGDEARAFEMHSSCVLRVEKQGETIGIAAELAIYLPGRTSSTQRIFIVAE